LGRSLAAVVRSMVWLSVRFVGVFCVPVVPGVPGLEFVLVLSGSKMVVSKLVTIAMSEAMLIGWHWVAC
jgi:hypothetical protein